MAVDEDTVELLTSMAAYSLEELEVQAAELEQEKEATEAESIRRKTLVNKIQHQRVSESGTVGKKLARKREEVASLERLLSRSLTVSKTGLAFLDQVTLQQGHISSAVLERLIKLDIAHEHVMSTYKDSAAAYAELLKSSPALTTTAVPFLRPEMQEIVGSSASEERARHRAKEVADASPTAINVEDSDNCRRTAGTKDPGASSLLSFRPSAMYGDAPRVPDSGSAPPVVQQKHVPANASASLPQAQQQQQQQQQQRQQQQLPSHIRMIAPEEANTGNRPMAMSKTAGTATVGGAVGVVTGLKLRPTSEFQAN